MTVSSTSRLAGPFVGTGVSAALPFTFKVFAATDIEVVRDGTPLALTTHYTVALNADQDTSPGGTVTILAAANTLGSTVYVNSAVDTTQQTSLPSQEAWYPKVVERALDKLAIGIQQLFAKVARTFVVPLGESGGTLPALASRKGKVLGFDATTGAPAVYAQSDFVGPPGVAGPSMSVAAFYTMLDAMLAAGTNATITRDSSAHTFTISVTSSAAYSTENMQDDLNTTLLFGADISGAYNDPAGTYTISLAAGIPRSTEAVQDIVGALLASGTGIIVTYNDAGNVETIAVDPNSVTEAPIPASGMVVPTANGAASGTIESATNKVLLPVLDFDASTKEYAQFVIPRLPKSWNVASTITARFIFAAGGTGDVVFGMEAVAISHDDVYDAAFGTGQIVTTSVTAITDLMHSAATPAITIGGTPAVGDTVVFRVYRDAANAADTCTVDARLVGVLLKFASNARDDS